MSRAMGWGGGFCRPCDSGSDSAGTEPRRERPRLGRAFPAPRPVKGSFTSRFLVSMCREKWGDICRLTRAIARPVRVRIAGAVRLAFSRGTRPVQWNLSSRNSDQWAAIDA